MDFASNHCSYSFQGSTTASDIGLLTMFFCFAFYIIKCQPVFSSKIVKRCTCVRDTFSYLTTKLPGTCLSFEMGIYFPYLLKMKLFNEKKISEASELTNLRSISG